MLNRDGDQVMAVLAPDADLALDASHCIILRTHERRVTVTDVAAWVKALRLAGRAQDALTGIDGYQVEARRNSLSPDWYPAPEVAPSEVEARNREYGWRKYRVREGGGGGEA